MHSGSFGVRVSINVKNCSMHACKNVNKLQEKTSFKAFYFAQLPYLATLVVSLVYIDGLGRQAGRQSPNRAELIVRLVYCMCS